METRRILLDGVATTVTRDDEELVAPDGRSSRFPRALCRYTTAEGTGTAGAYHAGVLRAQYLDVVLPRAPSDRRLNSRERKAHGRQGTA